jgi:hypothetical protein
MLLFRLKLNNVTPFVGGHSTEVVAQANDPSDIAWRRFALESHGKISFLQLRWKKYPYSTLTLERNARFGVTDQRSMALQSL